MVEDARHEDYDGIRTKPLWTFSIGTWNILFILTIEPSLLDRKHDSVIHGTTKSIQSDDDSTRRL